MIKKISLMRMLPLLMVSTQLLAEEAPVADSKSVALKPLNSGFDWGSPFLCNKDVDATVQQAKLYTLHIKGLAGDPEAIEKALYTDIPNICGARISIQEGVILLRLKSGLDLSDDLVCSESSGGVLSVQDGLVSFAKKSGWTINPADWIQTGNTSKTLKTEDLDAFLSSGEYVLIKLEGSHGDDCSTAIDSMIGMKPSVCSIAYNLPNRFCLIRLRKGYILSNDEIQKAIPSFMPFKIPEPKRLGSFSGVCRAGTAPVK